MVSVPPQYHRLEEKKRMREKGCEVFDNSIGIRPFIATERVDGICVSIRKIEGKK
jgi:hypothetical protein